MVIDGLLVPACLPGVPDHLLHSQLSDGLIWVICTQPACRPVAVGFGARNAPAHHRAYSPGASGCVQIALHIKKATVSGAHPSRKSPHAPLPLNPDPGTAALERRKPSAEKRKWTREQNKQLRRENWKPAGCSPSFYLQNCFVCTFEERPGVRTDLHFLCDFSIQLKTELNG